MLSLPAKIRQLSGSSDAGHPLKRMLNQQACYALGLVGMKGIALLLLPYLTRTLGVAEFARLETLLALVNGATLVVGFGLVNGLYRNAGLAADADSERREAARVIGAALWIALGCLLLLALSAYWLLPVLNRFWTLSLYEYSLLCLLITTEGVLAVPLAWLRMQQQASRFLVLTLGRTLIYALLAVVLLQSGFGLAGVLSASVLAVGLQVILLLRYQLRDTGIDWRPGYLLRQLRFGLPFVVSGLAMYATQGLDILLLSQHATPEHLAAYVLAIKFFLLAALLSQPFQLWWYPRRIGLSQTTQGREEAASGAMLGALLASVLGLWVVAAVPLILPYLFPTGMAEAAHYLPWLILAGILKQWGALFNLGCFTTERSEIQMLLELAVGGFCLLLFPVTIATYGVSGALAVFLLSQLVRLLAYYHISQRILPLNYRRRQLVLALMPCGLILLQSQWPVLNQAGLLVQLVWLLATLVLGCALLWLMLISRRNPDTALMSDRTADEGELPPDAFGRVKG